MLQLQGCGRAEGGLQSHDLVSATCLTASNNKLTWFQPLYSSILHGLRSTLEDMQLPLVQPSAHSRR